MEIIIIAAMAQNRIIGINNKLPWHIPEELKLFKKKTMGCPMIMGRKTFESFPAPLPGRKHIVLSRNINYQPKGGEYAASLSEAIGMCGEAEKIFIIGGAQIFTQAFDVATTIALTLLDRDVEGDVTFPDFSTEKFVEESRTAYPDGSEPFTVVTYRQK
ncbi:MAG: dihydrofolate reductase [Desulforhopalus sp.]|jgi:dihydrofolate reductase